MELFFFLCLSFLVVGYILGVSDLNKNSLVWLQKGLSCAFIFYQSVVNRFTQLFLSSCVNFNNFSTLLVSLGQSFKND